MGDKVKNEVKWWKAVKPALLLTELASKKEIHSINEKLTSCLPKFFQDIQLEHCDSHDGALHPGCAGVRAAIKAGKQRQ